LSAETKQTVFQISHDDNVATALTNLEPGAAAVNGEKCLETADVAEEISMGQKLALHDIKAGEQIVKYGVIIGQATKDIAKGQWVHLHNMKSLYDARSSSLDAVTGAPTDTRYE